MTGSATCYRDFQTVTVRAKYAVAPDLRGAKTPAPKDLIVFKNHHTTAPIRSHRTKGATSTAVSTAANVLNTTARANYLITASGFSNWDYYWGRYRMIHLTVTTLSQITTMFAALNQFLL